MVFFVCDGCNETVKKNQVDKHAQRCRKCYSVTCVDCSVSFYGDDYAQHVTCVSEAEKYEKSLFKPKAAKANPQDAWVALIEEATSGENASKAPSSIRSFLPRLGALSNVPRNKKKFINFCKNSLRLHNDASLEALWSYLDNFRASLKPAQSEEHTSASNETTISGQVKDKETKKTPETKELEQNVAVKKEIREQKKLLKKRKRKEESQEDTIPGIQNDSSIPVEGTLNSSVPDGEADASKKKKLKKNNKFGIDASAETNSRKDDGILASANVPEAAFGSAECGMQDLLDSKKKKAKKEKKKKKDREEKEGNLQSL